MPARTGFTSRTTCHISLDNNYTRETVKYIRRLRTGVFGREVKYFFETSAAHKGILQQDAREIIQTHVYDVREEGGYKRTFDLLNSFFVEPDDGGSNTTGALSLYSDPEVATAELGQADWSYAAFFEEPGFKTFIRPRGVADYPENYRPFFSALEDLMERRIPVSARDATIDALLILMPSKIFAGVR